jgi:hypothetical protein
VDSHTHTLIYNERFHIIFCIKCYIKTSLLIPGAVWNLLSFPHTCAGFFLIILIVYCIIFQIFQEARRNLPSIIYVPAIAQWWNLVPETLHAVFLSHLCKLDPSAPILLIATADIPYHSLPQEVGWNV